MLVLGNSSSNAEHADKDPPAARSFAAVAACRKDTSTVSRTGQKSTVGEPMRRLVTAAPDPACQLHSRVEVETFCRCWCQMDADNDGDVELEEFANFFSKRKVDRCSP